MAEFAFDLSALVIPPPPPAPLPPPNTRSSARFEDHLGQAARTPRDGAAESSRRSAEEQPEHQPTPATPKAADSKPAEASDQGREDDSQQEPQNEVDDVASDASGAERAAEDDASKQSAATAAATAAAAAAQAGDKLPSKAAAKRSAGELHESKTERAGGKAAKPVDENPRGKLGKQSSVAAKERAAELNLQAGSSEAKDAQKEEGLVEEQSPIDKTLTGEQKLAPDAAAESTGDTQEKAAAANLPAVDGVPKSGAVQTAITKKAETDAPVAAAQAAEPAARTEAPNSGKRIRGKSDESVAGSGAQPSPGQEVATATAPSGAAVVAIANTPGDDAESTGKDPSSEDVKSSDRNEKNESRVAAAPALLAARSDKGHEPNGRADGLTEAERVRFVQRVASAFRSLGDEGGEMRLRLSPPELGSLRLELTVRDGVLSARLETETSTARNLLLDNLPALRDRLAEQNIKVEKFDVDVRDERRQQSGEHFAGQADQGRQEQRQRQRAFENRAVTAAAERATRGPIKHGDASELNIVI